MSSRARAGLVAIVLCAVVGLYVGWRTFWFNCDDSYIAFRYVSNSVLGHGYVWNPPPWRPVEGYSSFLFVVLLDWIWRTFGVEPPVSANLVDLAFSYGSLALVIAMALELRLSERLARHRIAIVALVVLGTLTNRTFLAWTSSGLETAMFGFWLRAWVYVGLFRPLDRARLMLLATLAGVLELSRPDGLLFLLATVAMLGLDVGRRAVWRELSWRDLLPWTPLAIPVAHVAWRLQFYGYPLPNTAYAKHTSPWPDMGLVYLGSFLIEYGFWVWLLLAGALGVRLLRGGRLWARAEQVPFEDGMRAAVVATVVGQALYYVLIIGGDHFEYRVLEPLVPFAYLSLPWLADRLGWRPRRALAAFAVMLLVGWPIPWSHWRYTHGITERFKGGLPTHRLDQHVIWPLSEVVGVWDDMQRHMIRHFVGMRHQTHVIYGTYVQPKEFPSRAEGSKVRDPKDPPVLVKGGVGYPAWVLPHVAIIDYRGLNDVVVARTPVDKGRRLIAHEREPPAGYTKCFEPNVDIDNHGKVKVRKREKPLRPRQVKDCERRYLKAVTEG